MTIAAGFRCADGVVLCADTEISIQGWTKFPGSKIRMYNKLTARPIFTFAGDVLFCEMFIRKLAGRILATEKGGGEMIAAIEDEAFQIHKRFQDEAYEAESDLLMSLWFERAKQKQRILVQISRGIVSALSEACLGTGQFVAQGIIAELFRSEMSVKTSSLDVRVSSGRGEDIRKRLWKRVTDSHALR